MTGTMLFVIGPPAVGKMTVGAEIAARTGLRLFHNHMAIEPVLRFFPGGSAPFGHFVPGPDYLRLDNTHLSPAEAATAAVTHFGLEHRTGDH
ncbi:hypothetical protein [Actinoplanes couchii]|uniref:Shikimate kinase n=1 Tax=Actinoplanes couchii TaxID=403638 RepID=A0ABQ3XKY8_9ACTN|nr:hypothetical protein [Actinoplanes couchii]MDR6319439.1 hypothetical protein [Actinoplanes couchii]GID59170.1 hypothetical protein Aco03nite_075740 [Actinoplanes couchii]